MSTKRTVINLLREELRERNADSTYPNQFLYNVLLEHSKWLIKREISAGRIYRNTTFFQTLPCREVIEVSSVDSCCPVKTNCTIYRTKNKLPEIWDDTVGPIIRAVTSVDGSTDFFPVSASDWQNKKNDPYQKMADLKYSIYSDGYLWFPAHNPNLVNIYAFFKDDVKLIPQDKCEGGDCDNKEDCIVYLDTKFFVPDWIEAEIISKAAEQLAGITKRLPEDNQIDKNPTRKN